MNTQTAIGFGKLLGVLGGLVARLPLTIAKPGLENFARQTALVTLLVKKKLLDADELKAMEDEVRACLTIENFVGGVDRDVERAVAELQQKIEGMIAAAVKEIEKSERREAG